MSAFGRILRKRWVTYGLLCLPLLSVALPVLQGDVEYFADPAKYLMEYVGLCATGLYVAVMAITPLRMLFKKSDALKALATHRRQIGVSVFVYALLHLVIYYFYSGSWSVFFEDWGKLFILSGLIGLLLLLILAVTSNNWSIKSLGGKKWKRLHWLAHLTMIFLIYHQAAQEKEGFRETMYFFGPLLALQAYRVAAVLLKRRASAKLTTAG